MTAYRKSHSCETTFRGLRTGNRLSTQNNPFMFYLLIWVLGLRLFESLSDNKEVGGLWLWKWISRFDAIVFRKQKKQGKNGWNYKHLETYETWKSARIILWNLLWNMFQNDLPLHVENGNITMYPDDHQLHVKGTNHEIVRQQLKTSSKLWYGIQLTFFQLTQRIFSS